MKIFLKILLIFLFLSSPTFSKENVPSASIVYIKGKVVIDHKDHRKFLAKVGDILVDGDLIETADDSFAIVRFPDSSKIKIGANSEVNLAKIHTHINDNYIGETSLVLKYGHLIMHIVDRDGEPAHMIHTQYAEFGVRGTRLFIAKERSEKHVWASVEEGVVEVSHKNNPDHKEALLENEGIVITEKEFTHPKKYQWVKKLNYDVDHRESHTGGFRKYKDFRVGEFKEKKLPWKDSGRLADLRKTKWNKAEEDFLKKNERYKKQYEIHLDQRKSHRRSRLNQE